MIRKNPTMQLRTIMIRAASLAMIDYFNIDHYRTTSVIRIHISLEHVEKAIAYLQSQPKLIHS